MKLTIEFLFLIGSTIQIIQSEEIIVDRNTPYLGVNVVNTNTQNIGATSIDRVWNSAYDTTTSGYNWFKNYLSNHIPEDLNKAKDYIYSTAASAKNYAYNAGIAMMNYAGATGVKINGLRQSTISSDTVNKGEIEVNTEIKQVHTIDTVNTIENAVDGV